jgi:hypothetical protein
MISLWKLLRRLLQSRHPQWLEQSFPLTGGPLPHLQCQSWTSAGAPWLSSGATWTGSSAARPLAGHHPAAPAKNSCCEVVKTFDKNPNECPHQTTHRSYTPRVANVGTARVICGERCSVTRIFVPKSRSCLWRCRLTQPVDHQHRRSGASLFEGRCRRTDAIREAARKNGLTQGKYSFPCPWGEALSPQLCTRCRFEV